MGYDAPRGDCMKYPRLSVSVLSCLMASSSVSFAGSFQSRSKDHYEYLCSKQVERKRITERNYIEFERYEVKPLRDAYESAKDAYNYEVKRPKELAEKVSSITRNKIPAKQREISRDHEDLAKFQAEYDRAIASGASELALRIIRGRLNQAKKRLAEDESDLAELEGRVTAYNRERDTILNTPPTADELRTVLMEKERKLSNINQLREEKRQERDEMNENLNICVGYYMEKDAYDYMFNAIPAIRISGCNVLLPPTTYQGMVKGKTDALRAMGCQF